MRLMWAGVVCQGISSDPELFVNRPGLLAAYSMIEHLFVTADGGGNAVLSAAGRRHVALVERYRTLIAGLAPSLLEDCAAFRPAAGSYSPYGVMYGFSSNILEHMTLKALYPDAETRFSLEDVFSDTGAGAQRLAWVTGWRRLPHVPAQVLKLYEYPQQFAEEIFGRIERALRDGAAMQAGPGRTGRMLLPAAQSPASAPDDMADLPAEFVLSSDATIVAAGKARPCEEQQLLGDRHEGMYLVSYRTAGGWTAISKNVLTGLLGNGRDVRITGLPDAAVAVVKLMYPQLTLAS